MNLWSLLSPFKWFIIGVSEVFKGFVILLKAIASLLGSLFKNLFKGIIIISRGIIFIIKDIIVKYLFLSIKWVVLKIILLFTLFFRGLGFVFLGFFKTLKFIAVNTFEGFMTVVKLLINGIKYLFIYLYKGIVLILKYVILIIKYIAIYIYKTFYFIFKYIFFGFKYIFVGLKTLLIYIGKIFKFVLVDILYKCLKGLLLVIYNGLITILRFIIKLPLFIWKGIKAIGRGLYNITIVPIVNIFTFLGRTISNAMKEVTTGVKKGIKAITNIPSNISKGVVNWFNNLSFVKDLRNRRDMKHKVLLIDFDAEDAARSEKKILYHFVAKNVDGKIEKGNLGAFSKLDVHSYLLAEGYEVYEIVPAKGIQLSFGGQHKLKVNELVFFLTQLSTYIKSGIPLVDSIKILGKQSKKKNTQGLYKALIYDLTMGDSFSEALEKQGASFPKLLVNMVKSSELAGNLSETLDDMGDYYESVSQTRRQMKSAMTYPTVILVFAVSVVVFILTFVIPSFIQMYKDADAEVPAITTIIIGISDFLINNAIWLILGLIATGFGLYFLYKNVKIFKLLVQWLLMHMPIIGKIIIYNEVTMFSKTFASLWNHNVFITSSMEILSKITENEIYKMLIFDAITNVARGETVSSSFKNHWAFPVVAYEMLVTGERTGQPGPMMDKVASYYQEEHRNAINQVKAFIEPALIVFLAAVVGTILLAVVIPMFGIYSQIGLE